MRADGEEVQGSIMIGMPSTRRVIPDTTRGPEKYYMSLEILTLVSARALEIPSTTQ
jgi:hypothetical protein